MLVVGHEEGGEDAPDHQEYGYLEPDEILADLQGQNMINIFPLFARPSKGHPPNSCRGSRARHVDHRCCSPDPCKWPGESQKTGCTNYVTDNRESQNYEPAVQHSHLPRLVRHIDPDLCEGRRLRMVGQRRLLMVSILHPEFALLPWQGINVCMKEIQSKVIKASMGLDVDLTLARYVQIFMRIFTHLLLLAKGQLADNWRGDFG